MSSLLSDSALSEGEVLAGATIIRYMILGIIVFAFVTAFIFQQKGLAIAGNNFMITLTNFFTAPAYALMNILQSVVSLIWTTIQNFGNGVVNGAKSVGTGVTNFFTGIHW